MYREFKENRCKEDEEEEIKAKWKREQLELKQHLAREDLACWATHRVTPANASDHTGVQPLEYIGGMNISFVKGDNVNACAALVVVKLPSLEVVYEDCSLVELTDPYVPEFSAFREGKVLIDKIKKLKATSPEYMPQVILCDGNGILHAQEFGLACHVGVLLDLPAVGVSTELCQVLGVENNEEHKQKIEQLHNRQDSFPLIGYSGRTLGVALRGNAKTKNPIYISPGHQLTVETAVWVVQQCCPYRVPEPVRQAAIRSRKLLYQHFSTEADLQKRQSSKTDEHSKHMLNDNREGASTSKLSKGKKSKDFHVDTSRHDGISDSGVVAMVRNAGEAEAAPSDCSEEYLAEAEELHVEEEIKATWEREQLELKQRLVLEDVADWAQHRVTPDNTADWPGVRPLQYLGGVDISFVKGDNVNACAALIVVELPSLEVVYEDCSHVQLTAPYIPGFLAFREVKFLIDKIEKLKVSSPELMPQVILCDGNGILHPREFGIASHLGVLLDLPALGAAKKLFQVFGLEKDEEHRRKIEQLENPQDSFPLIGDTGRTLGVALRSNAKTKNPVYISPGHQLTVETAVWVVQQCCPYRVPEPIRQADLRSREFLRQHFPTEENSPKTNSKKSPSRNVKDMSSKH